MKKLMLILVTLFTIHSVVMADNDVPVPLNQLPQQAQQFIKTHFTKSEISYGKMEKEWFQKNYDVIFTNGDKVEFDKNGNWKEIDCKHNILPTAIVPKAILDYVTQNHPNTKIKKIERDRNSYEIELTNGLELKFNKQFKAIRIER